ncbi:MAG: cysteine desulfurase [Lachnospiraceae bacterium]|nr:cysteine desulfurase [Lachnospiraceae bacterium]
MACINKTTGRIIYMDNAATTPLYDEALEAMMPYLKGGFANPAAIYDIGQEAAGAVAAARSDIASTLGARPNEIYFTSGGTEADNWAIKGVALGEYLSHGSHRRAAGTDRPHIITSAFEHHAVLNTCKWLEKNECRVSYVNPSADGIVPVSEIESHICKDTVLISVMLANNETGTIQSVREIGTLAHEHGILFHTDAVAAYGHIPVNVKESNIDLMSASAHKFNGPKGTGFLYVSEEIKLPPFMHGGAQEQGRRAGTVNVPGIVGMAAAAVSHHNDMEADIARLNELGSYFFERLSGLNASVLKGSEGLSDMKVSGEKEPGKDAVRINGCIDKRLPGSFNIMIPGVNAEELTVRLGMEGICVSAGAACATYQGDSSHVLKAMGLTKKEADSSIRISLSSANTMQEIDILFEFLRGIL